MITALELDIEFLVNVIFGGDEPYKGCLSPMADITDYDFKSLTNKIIKTE